MLFQSSEPTTTVTFCATLQLVSHKNLGEFFAKSVIENACNCITIVGTWYYVENVIRWGYMYCNIAGRTDGGPESRPT